MVLFIEAGESKQLFCLFISIVYICTQKWLVNYNIKMLHMSISDRIVYIQQQEGFTASKFAERLDVQRSGLSHIYSGRNNPSIDFIQKLIDKFPNYRAEWIISGKEPVKYQEEDAPLAGNEKDRTLKEQSDLFSTLKSEDKAVYKTPAANSKLQDPKANNTDEDKNVLEKVILVYKNGTFETLLPKN